MISEKVLGSTGDFPNKSVVEYATVFAKMNYANIPDNLKCHDRGMRHDANFITKVGFTPSGRLTNDELHLDSVELAEAFKTYVENLISKRKYEASLFVEVKTSTRTKLTAQRCEKHSNKVRELIYDEL